LALIGRGRKADEVPAVVAQFEISCSAAFGSGSVVARHNERCSKYPAFIAVQRKQPSVSNAQSLKPVNPDILRRSMK